MKIINIGILAHVDAGKTTVTEGLLYKSGVIRNRGRVDSGTTITDSMKLEKDRGITIRASTVSFDYKDTKINIIDTPGHMDFIAEVERTLRVLDGAILVISAKEGIQIQTKIIFNTLMKLKIPAIIFINKIDRDGVDLDKLYIQIKEKLTDKISCMQKLSIKDDDYNLSGLEDEKVRDEIFEKVLDINEKLGDKYLLGEGISDEEYFEGFLEEVSKTNLYPVLHGSALKDIGLEELLSAITKYLGREKSPSKELSAYVYKIDRDSQMRKLTYMKVVSGNIKMRDDVFINETERSFKIKNLETIKNAGFERVERVESNDIAILVDDSMLKIGDFIGVKPSEFKTIEMAKPALKAAIKPVELESRSKLITALYELTEEDPFLDCEVNKSTGELGLKLFGEVQMEVIESILIDRYDIEVDFGELKTIYKERPKKSSKAVIHIEVTPNPYWASVELTLEPLPLGSGLIYETNVSYGYLNSSFQQAVKDAVSKACKQGLHGWEVTDLRVTFSYGLYYSPVSSPSDFRNLTPYVFWEALRNAETEILEPYLNYTVEIPNEYCGKVISDIKSMGGSMEEMKSKGEKLILTGKVPVNTSKSYQGDLFAFSNGEGMFITEPLGYDVYKGELVENDMENEDINKGLRHLFEKQNS